MQYFIVGSLLILIIIVAGWLISFYSRMLNRKAVIDEDWRALRLRLRRKREIIEDEMGVTTDNLKNIPVSSEIEKLEVKIKEDRDLYNEKILDFNIFLNKFPNNFACKILGIQELSFFQTDDIYD